LATFGRGGATTAQQDLANADAILIMGSNMAENHPVGFQWVVEARARGAKIMHVDPRFSRTSAMADIWAPIRAGSDIAFLGGIIHYILENEKDFREYVINYTNAPVILRDDVKLPDENEGVFSGWNPETNKYDTETWLYKGEKVKGAGVHGMPAMQEQHAGHALRGAVAGNRPPEMDRTLQHPRCVYQLLKRHFARYTPELVEELTGCPRDVFLKICETMVNASGPDKTAAVCYGVGWTQHSTAAQMIRTGAIMQLLLGNIGRPGGGVLALRGHASIQGSTDIPTLYDIMPGYLPMPIWNEDGRSFEVYVDKHTTSAGVWHNFPGYFISLMKAWYGDNAREDNDWGFHFLPKLTGDHSHLGYTIDMMEGKVEGMFIMGQNPAVGSPNSRVARKALSKLKWLVVRDLVEVKSASFWYDSLEVERGELKPEEIATEVFLFPAASHVEKEGMFTNTQRLLQFHEKAVEPPGDCRSEMHFIFHLGKRLKEMAARDANTMHDALRALTWDYPVEDAIEEPVVDEIDKEINGYTVPDGKLISDFNTLKADGTTACGCWIYCGMYPQEGKNLTRSKRSHDFLGHGWGFAWPKDVRIIYNRASARPDGRPWSEKKALIWWDAQQKKWTGHDTPDFPPTKAPDYEVPQGAEGMDGISGTSPFTLHPDGLGWIWAPTGLKDGPLPTHYEPIETPVRNTLYPKHETNPVAEKKIKPYNDYASLRDQRFPFVMTTYRLTEHHTSGGMSRTLPHLAELQPEMFCEVSPELAAERGLEHGRYATIMSPRGVIEARVLVSHRMRPLVVEGKTIHQIGLPWHWSSKGIAKGDSANDLLAINEEPNVRIMESKALLCNIFPGRRPKHGRDLSLLKELMKETA
jgi:formate dehydrogenase major subunit